MWPSGTPPFLASIQAGAGRFQAWILGGWRMFHGRRPDGFRLPLALARTLLGYYDTDLVTLLFRF